VRRGGVLQVVEHHARLDARGFPFGIDGENRSQVS
jgi:hypothetical protein